MSPFPRGVRTDPIQLHKTKHLLTHVLTAAVSLPWRQHARTLWVTRISGTVVGAAACGCSLCVG